MTVYYFDLRDGDDLIQDEEGLELPDYEAVQMEAAKALSDMARDTMRGIPDTKLARKLAIEVRDDKGPVMTARFWFDIQRHQ